MNIPTTQVPVTFCTVQCTTDHWYHWMKVGNYFRHTDRTLQMQRQCVWPLEWNPRARVVDWPEHARCLGPTRQHSKSARQYLRDHERVLPVFFRSHPANTILGEISEVFSSFADPVHQRPYPDRASHCCWSGSRPGSVLFTNWSDPEPDPTNTRILDFTYQCI